MDADDRLVALWGDAVLAASVLAAVALAWWPTDAAIVRTVVTLAAALALAGRLAWARRRRRTRGRASEAAALACVDEPWVAFLRSTAANPYVADPEQREHPHGDGQRQDLAGVPGA